MSVAHSLGLGGDGAQMGPLSVDGSLIVLVMQGSLGLPHQPSLSSPCSRQAWAPTSLWALGVAASASG